MSEEVSHSIRFPKELHEQIKAWAEQEARSFNAHVVFILERELAKYNYAQALKKEVTETHTEIVE